MKWLNCGEMKVLLVVFAVLVALGGRDVKAESFSIRPAADVTVCNDAQRGPDISFDGASIEARDIPPRRRVGLISYDISELKGKGLVSNVTFNHVSGDQHGETNVYGVIEELDLLQVELLTWNTAPGVQNNPTPALGSPVALDMNDLTGILLTFSGPGEKSIRFSTGIKQTLDDFINSDTDGILTFLLAPSEEGKQFMVLASEWSDGGSLLQGVVAPVDVAAYYAMESDASDSSGNGYDGILFGDPNFVKGVEDMALGFDYWDDYIELPIGPLVGSLTDCSITTWVDWPGLGGAWQRVFDFGSGEEINMFLTPNIEGARTPRFAITPNSAENEDQMTAPDALTAGWHHMAVTIDPNNTTHSLYIDGIFVAQNTSARYTPSSLGETTQNYLGKSQYNDPLLHGSLDEFKIYPRVLSEAEIVEMVTQQMPTSGLIAHWKLDEAEGRVAYDSVSQDHAIFWGDPVWQPDGGIVDGALQFDGVDDLIYTESYFLLDTAYSEFSVFAWVKGGAPGQVVVSQYGRNKDWLYADPANGCLMTELRHDVDNDPQLLSETVITDGEWHQVGLVWDLSKRTLYVDDMEVASDEQESIGDLNGYLNIGSGKGVNPTAGSYWSGLIDDVRIYNRAITP